MLTNRRKVFTPTFPFGNTCQETPSHSASHSFRFHVVSCDRFTCEKTAECCSPTCFRPRVYSVRVFWLAKPHFEFKRVTFDNRLNPRRLAPLPKGCAVEGGWGRPSYRNGLALGSHRC